jgi:hypothetical protein
MESWNPFLFISSKPATNGTIMAHHFPINKLSCAIPVAVPLHQYRFPIGEPPLPVLQFFNDLSPLIFGLAGFIIRKIMDWTGGFAGLGHPPSFSAGTLMVDGISIEPLQLPAVRFSSPAESS